MTKTVLDNNEYKTLYDSVKFGRYYIYFMMVALFILLIRNNLLTPLHSDIRSGIRSGIIGSTTILLLRDKYTIHILVFISFAETILYTLYCYSIGFSVVLLKESILKITKTYAKTLLIVIPLSSFFIIASYNEVLNHIL